MARGFGLIVAGLFEGLKDQLAFGFCSSDSECVNGYCVNDVCCKTSNCGECQTCNGAENSGTCTKSDVGWEYD